MSEQRQQPTSGDDRELLDNIERIVAGEASTGPDSHDAASIHTFAAHLAASTPQADGDYRAQLLARLQRELYGDTKPSQAQPAIRSHTHTVAAPDTAPTGPNTPSGKRAAQPPLLGPARLFGPLRPVVESLRTRRGGRFAPAALGVAGSLLMVVLLVGMAAMLNWRQEGQSGQTPVATIPVLLPPNQTPGVTGTPLNELEELASLMEPRLTIALTTTALIRSLAWSPDGQVLAAIAPNAVLFWDASTGKLLHTTNVPNLPEGLDGFDEFTPEFGLAWSPDAEKLAAGTFRSSIVLIDAGSGQISSTIPLPTPTTGPNPIGGSGYDPSRDYVHSLAWSPDGTQLAAASEQRPVLVFEPGTGRVIRSYGDYRFTLFPNSLHWSRDGRTLTIPDDLGLRIASIDVSTGGITWSPVLLPRMSTPSTMVAGVTASATPTIDLYVPGKELDSNPFAEVSDLAWSPARNSLALVQGKTTVLWDPQSGQELRRFSEPQQKGWIDRVAWSHDGRLLASIGDGIQLWNPATGKPLRSLMENTGVLGNLAWSPTAYTLAVSHRDANINNRIILYVHRPDPRQPAPTYTPKAACGFWELVPSPNSGQVNVLHAVAALSRDDAWAVGYTSDNRDPHTDHSMHESAGARTLIQHWDGAQWSIVPSPNAGTSNYLRGIAALAPDDVWAVGYFTSTSGLEQTLIQHWNGKEWSIVPSPYYAGLDNRLAGIAAVSPNDIWAVGSYGDNYAHDKPAANPARTLTLHWDGSTWEIVPSPNPSRYTNRLYSIAARSSAEVWAVGYQLTDPGTSPETRQAIHLVLRWNGTEWVTEDAPITNLALPEGFIQHTLLDVTVDGAGNVLAVGASGTENRSFPIALGRDLSGRWSSLNLPAFMFQPSGVGLLSGIAALTTNDVWAVGADSGEPVIMGYDGSSWYRTMSPSPDGQIAGLFSVASDGAGGAWAVGYSGPHDAHRTLILRYDASRFCGSPTVLPVAPNPSPSIPAGPTQESLPVPTAIPTDAEGLPTAQALCKSWQVVASPNPDNFNELQAVAAVSSDDVWAVGYTRKGPTEDEKGVRQMIEPDRTLILHWNGKTWDQVRSPNVGPGDNHLTSVTAISKDDVWAVGHYNQGRARTQVADREFWEGIAPDKTLILHWDGTAWETITSPNVANASNRLNAVTAVASDDVWAVGSYGDGDYFLWLDDGHLSKVKDSTTSPQTLILHWDGKAWKHVPSPSPGPYFNNLRRVAAFASDLVWAVGEQSGDKLSKFGPGSGPLILRWDGSRWDESPLPSEANLGVAIMAVTTVSRTEAWAASINAGEGGSMIILLRWNGSEWQLTDQLNLMAEFSVGMGPPQDYPAALVSTSSSDVWLVGHHSYTEIKPGDASARPAALTLHWDGTKWEAISSPNVSFEFTNENGTFTARANVLRGIALLPKGDAWAVGGVGGGDESHTLILHYTASPCPAPSP